MKKTAVLNEIMSVYDENDELKRQIELMKRGAAATSGLGDLAAIDSTASITAMCIDIGRRHIFESIINKYRAGADYNYETGTYKYLYANSNYKVYIKRGEPGLLTYDQWVKTLDWDLFNNNDSSNRKEKETIMMFIRSFSLNDIIEYFHEELQGIYDSLCNDYKMALVRQAQKEE